MTVFVFSFSQGSPFQTLAAQRFTIICMNLQMWLSSGIEVAEFAFLLDPCVNVSKLFQRARDTPSSSFNLQIHLDSPGNNSSLQRLIETKQNTVYPGDITSPLETQKSHLLLLLPQGGLKRVNCFMDLRRRSTVYFEQNRLTVHLACLMLQMSVCVAKTSFFLSH